MKKLALAFIAFYSFPIMAQIQVTQEQKDKQIAYALGTIYQGCLSGYERSQPNPQKQLESELRLEPVAQEEMKLRSDNIMSIMDTYYKYAFEKAPEMRKALQSDLETLVNDKSCQQSDNYCRGQLIATAKFYMDYLRPTDPNCEGFDPSKLSEKESFQLASQMSAVGMNYSVRPSQQVFCNLEFKQKDKPVDRYDRMDPRSRYEEHTTELANASLMKIQKDVLAVTSGYDKKTKREIKSLEVHICDPSKSKDSELYNYPLRGNYYKQNSYAVVTIGKKETPKSEPKECIEEKTTLYSEFVPTNFDEGRSTVGMDQIAPVKAKIMDFINSNPNMIVTDVTVISSSSRTPFTKIINNKKVIDPQSDERNLALANERSGFASQVLGDMKKSSSELAEINFDVKSELAGPEFSESDFALRKINPSSAGYSTKVKEMYDANKELFSSQALRKSSDELMDAKQFPSLYHAKYKPFQGFRIVINGYVKEKMKCSDHSSAKPSGSGTKSGAAKQ